jgi:energy-coupling factor transporter ATP-binding protein EcfA2
VPDSAIVIAAGLSYRYPERDEPALRDVTLELAPGGFTLLAGESGSGKSTLLRAFCGLVPHFHGGEVSGARASLPPSAARSSRIPRHRS